MQHCRRAPYLPDMRVISLHEYATIERPEVEWLIPGVVPKTGCIELVGPPRSSKTFLALQLCFAICTGGAFLGKRANPGKALYFYTDSDEQLFMERIRDLEAAGIPTPSNLLIPHPDDKPYPLNILNARTQKWMRSAVEQADPDFIVIDVLRKVHNAEENSSTEQKHVADIFEGIFKRDWREEKDRGNCILYLHHTTKIKSDAPRPRASDAGRGSGFMAGNTSSNWLMLGGILSMEGRFHEDLHYTYERDRHGLLSFPECIKTLDLMDQLVKLCERNPTLSHAQLAKHALELYQLPQSTYYRYMKGVACVHAVAGRSRIAAAVHREAVPALPLLGTHSADSVSETASH